MTQRTTITRMLLCACILLCTIIGAANATVAVSSLLGNNMVLQRDKSVPIWGTGTVGQTITVTFDGQTKTTTVDAQGNWQLSLDAMAAKATGGSLTITETGANTIALTNVVVGDVWVCSGQSNMAFGLGGCNRQVDIDSANFPAIRTFWAPLVTSRDPLKTVSGNWTVCSPATANGFSATAFYFGRKIYQETGIPTGLIVSSVGGTRIDPWLAPEGVSDVPVLQPLFSQEIMPWGPFSLFNGMVHPLAPFAAKGMIWYQGENSETTVQSPDSYFLKMKALSQGWKRLLGLDDFAFYFVQIANWGTQPSSATPVLSSGGWDADTRLQQTNAMSLPHAGMASALDIGESDDMHPKDKLDLGERLALWALKNEYGRSALVTSGPILRDVTVSGSTVVCSFDYVGSGLMVGLKVPYQPTAEVSGGTLQLFSIAGSNNTWYPATATISNNTVILSNTNVTAPKKVAYACWQNPLGANLYNKEGLPASPFYVDDVSAKFNVVASAGAGGSISPDGTTTYLKRHTALYTITPDSGYYIQDVKVDGVSVGSVSCYTFDPLSANHTIAATFAATAPTYTVDATGNASGSISPAGPVSMTQGTSQTFKMVPNANCRLLSVTVDGAPVGRRDSVTLTNVRANHTLAAVFGIIPPPSAGTGLRGDYYAGANFDTFRATRTDAKVNFDWGIGSPDPAIPVDGFSVRWTGQIQPQFTETYKFYLSHDDGARMWINNQLIINNWSGAGTDDTGTINLVAGQNYSIKIEYFDYLSNANCKLEWASPSLPREVVPQSQLFPATTPIYTLTASAGANGSLDPSGVVYANSGGTQTFNVLPSVGYYIADVKVDNSSIGAASSYTFGNITANHTISATFTAMPSYTVSGKVTKQGTTTAISGAKVCFYTSSNTIGNAAYTATTDASGNYSISVPMGTWSMNASAASYFTSATLPLTINNGPATNINFALEDGTRNIPRTADLLFSCVTDSLPASGSTGNWATYLPSGKTLTAMATPTVETIMGRKWEKNLYADNDGYRFGTSNTASIPCTGATITFVAKPTRSADGGNWRSIVDIFYDRLVLGIMNDSGKVCVRRNGSLEFSNSSIPDGQTTVLSLVVQTDGSYSVYANGATTAMLTGAATGANSFTALVPGVTGGAGGYGSYINVGHNNPDSWSTYNGYIGDVFVYKTALTTTERQTLETDLTKKFISGGATTCTINASCGTGGSISPNGTTMVTPGANQSYTIAPDAGYIISNVTVDGVSKGVISTFTFTGVTTSHTISATFAPAPISVANIAALKSKPAGTWVTLTGSPTVIYAPRATSAGARTTNYFYIGEAKALGGLKVVDKTSDTLTLGNKVTNLTGYVRKPAGQETYLELTVDPTGTGNTPIPSVGMNNRTVLTDANAQTNTVKVWGKVQSINGTTSFVISDGYSASGIMVITKGVELPSPFDTNSTVAVTGILSPDTSIQAQTVTPLR